MKQWHAEHDPKPGKEPLPEAVVYRSVSFDDMKPHLWNFFQAVQLAQAGNRRRRLRTPRRAGLPHGE